MVKVKVRTIVDKLTLIRGMIFYMDIIIAIKLSNDYIISLFIDLLNSLCYANI